MKLVDFKQDKTLDDLRNKMGAEEYGKFELFDPSRHLSWQERQKINSDWVEISSSSLHAYGDKTLAYKNSHIFCQTNDQLHFAFCDQIKKQMQNGKIPKVNITLKRQLLTGKEVCQYCLHAVAYQGFDVYRHRHKEYNEGILKKFNLMSYLDEKYK